MPGRRKFGILGGLGGVPAEARVLSAIALATAQIWRRCWCASGAPSSALLEGGAFARRCVAETAPACCAAAGGERRGDTITATGSGSRRTRRGSVAHGTGISLLFSDFDEVILQHTSVHAQRAPAGSPHWYISQGPCARIINSATTWKTEPSTMFRQSQRARPKLAAPPVRRHVSPRRAARAAGLAAVQRPGAPSRQQRAEASQRAASRRRPPPACQRSCASTCRRRRRAECVPNEEELAPQRPSASSSSTTGAETTVCIKGMGKAENCGCERSPLVQNYMGFKSMNDPLFRADQLMIHARREAIREVRRARRPMDEKADDGNGWRTSRAGGGQPGRWEGRGRALPREVAQGSRRVRADPQVDLRNPRRLDGVRGD